MKTPPLSSLKSEGRKSGFTIVEMMTTVTIISILASTIALSWAGLRARAERVGCTFHLRSLYLAFDSYCNEHGHWPQQPGGQAAPKDGPAYYNWIVGELDPYGGERRVWICPTEHRQSRVNVSEKNFEGSYVPTSFDVRPNSPWEWQQPWLVERQDFHEVGFQMIFPDGTISTSRELLGF